MGCCSRNGAKSVWIAGVASALGTLGIALAASDAKTTQESPLIETQPVDAETRGDAGELLEIDEAIDDLYAVISGPAGQERDWDRFRAMFTPTAHMGAFYTRQDGSVSSLTMTPEEYIERSGKMLVEVGFTERETHRVLEVYGSIAHAFSTYEGIADANDEEPLEVAGINSIQLVHTDDGWKIFSIIWNQASDHLPVPERYRGSL